MLSTWAIQRDLIEQHSDEMIKYATILRLGQEMRKRSCSGLHEAISNIRIYAALARYR
jgi:hypothetical protein